MQSNKFDKEAQMSPGINPHNAATAIVRIESRYSGKAIIPARTEPE